MEKKQYISPIFEVMDLRSMNAVMDEPLFGPASVPSDKFNTSKHRTKVF